MYFLAESSTVGTGWFNCKPWIYAERVETMKTLHNSKQLSNLISFKADRAFLSMIEQLMTLTPTHWWQIIYLYLRHSLFLNCLKERALPILICYKALLIQLIGKVLEGNYLFWLLLVYDWSWIWNLLTVLLITFVQYCLCKFSRMIGLGMMLTKSITWRCQIRSIVYGKFDRDRVRSSSGVVICRCRFWRWLRLIGVLLLLERVI